MKRGKKARIEEQLTEMISRQFSLSHAVRKLEDNMNEKFEGIAKDLEELMKNRIGNGERRVRRGRK